MVECVERLGHSWRDRLAKVEFAVEDIPTLDDWPHDWVPLARAFAATGVLPARIVIFRRPIETRARTEYRLRDLISDVIAEQVGEMLGVDPQEVDPLYGHRG